MFFDVHFWCCVCLLCMCHIYFDEIIKKQCAFCRILCHCTLYSVIVRKLIREYQLLGWVIIINGDGGCGFWQPVQADSQPKSSGTHRAYPQRVGAMSTKGTHRVLQGYSFDECRMAPSDRRPKGRRPLGAILHSSNEPGELSQWLCHGDSTINIVLVIIIIIIIIISKMLLYRCKHFYGETMQFYNWNIFFSFSIFWKQVKQLWCKLTQVVYGDQRGRRLGWG